MFDMMFVPSNVFIAVDFFCTTKVVNSGKTNIAGWKCKTYMFFFPISMFVLPECKFFFLTIMNHLTMDLKLFFFESHVSQWKEIFGQPTAPNVLSSQKQRVLKGFNSRPRRETNGLRKFQQTLGTYPRLLTTCL